MGYYDSVNEDLLALIPPDAKTVLEIGCGEGALCEAYRRINPGVEWTGIDSCGNVSNIADKQLDRFINIDIEDDHWTFTDDRKEFDCLILGDVLEHLREPWDILAELVESLKPGAQVLACIPNVQHWTIIRDLLEGVWEYADSGLMDRTHLRWFTLHSIRGMFADAGLQVYEIIGRPIFNDGMEEFIRGSGIAFKKEMAAYQYLVRAIKPSEPIIRDDGISFFANSDVPKKLHIHAVLAEACCASPRILEPMAMLRTIPGVKCSTGKIPQTIPDIVIMQRPRAYNPDWYPGSLIVTEVDDLPEAIGMDPMALKAVHAVQCSTEALAEVCRQYNPNVMVFENQIAELPPLKSEHIICSSQPELLCAWQNRESDWLPIIDALNDVLEDHPLVEVRVIHDQKFYDALTTDNKKFTPFCTYEEYRHRLRQASIALLPLEDTPFNRCKSDVKFLECAAEGVAVLASGAVYWDVMTLCGGGRFWNSEAGFTNALGQLIDDSFMRNRLAQNSYAYVRDNRLLSQHYRKRYEWYQSLLSSKPALDASMRERCPELTAHPATA